MINLKSNIYKYIIAILAFVGLCKAQEMKGKRKQKAKTTKKILKRKERINARKRKTRNLKSSAADKLC